MFHTDPKIFLHLREDGTPKKDDDGPLHTDTSLILYTFILDAYGSKGPPNMELYGHTR